MRCGARGEAGSMTVRVGEGAGCISPALPFTAGGGEGSHQTCGHWRPCASGELRHHPLPRLHMIGGDVLSGQKMPLGLSPRLNEDLGSLGPPLLSFSRCRSIAARRRRPGCLCNSSGMARVPVNNVHCRHTLLRLGSPSTLTRALGASAHRPAALLLRDIFHRAPSYTRQTIPRVWTQ